MLPRKVRHPSLLLREGYNSSVEASGRHTQPKPTLRAGLLNPMARGHIKQRRPGDRKARCGSGLERIKIRETAPQADLCFFQQSNCGMTSTSPAYAAMRLEAKVQAWSVVKKVLS